MVRHCDLDLQRGLLTLVSCVVPGWLFFLGWINFGAALGFPHQMSSAVVGVLLVGWQGSLVAVCLMGLRRGLEKRLFPLARTAP